METLEGTRCQTGSRINLCFKQLASFLSNMKARGHPPYAKHTIQGLCVACNYKTSVYAVSGYAHGIGNGSLDTPTGSRKQQLAAVEPYLIP